ncbi:hypothetical protein FOFC_13875 [Fusarium oxysporum]|nr:hypothetical protein FOFC_13875 [Fusarium oxysporum]
MPAPSFSSTPSSSRSADQFTELIIQPSIESSAKKSTTPSTGPLSSPSSVRAPRPLADGAFPIRWGALQYNNKRLSDAHYYMKHKRTTGKTKKSWIWDHGANIESENEQYWLCRRCHETGSDCSTIFKYNGNSAIAYHLKHKHGISEDGEVPQHIRVSNPWDRSKKANSFGPLRTPIAGEGYRQQYLDWVVAHDVSFRSATAGDTCDLLSYGRPELERLLPTSATTLSSWIMAAFETRRESLKAELKECRSAVHLSCDLWTSTSGMSLCGVVAHFVGVDYTNHQALLGLPRLYGSHSGENIANCLSSVVTQYDLEPKLGCFMMDNAQDNDRAVLQLATRFGFDPDWRRLRCSGHVINLVVRAILYGKGVSKAERQLQCCNDQESFSIWRQRGVIGKVHNIVRYITRSDQRRQHFETLQAEALQDDELFSLQLIKDGGIRWNSTFSMLERALKLRNAIELFCAQWERDADYDLSQDFLKRSDWEEIQRFVALLKPFKDATLELEGHAIHGNYGALWQALEMMDILDGLLQEEKAAVAADPRSYSNYYVAGLDAGYTKLMKYFDLTAKTPYYRAAICLVPSFKLLYFKDKWRSHEIWVDTVEPDVRQLYNEYATKYSITEPASPPQQTEQPQQTPELGRFKLHRRLDRSVDVDSNSDRRKRRRMVDEFERYLYDEDVVEPFVEEPLTWWREREKSYPILTQMAFDLFSIPAMSAECERVFTVNGLFSTVRDVTKLEIQPLGTLQPPFFALPDYWTHWQRLSFELAQSYEHVRHWREQWGYSSLSSGTSNSPPPYSPTHQPQPYDTITISSDSDSRLRSSTHEPSSPEPNQIPNPPIPGDPAPSAEVLFNQVNTFAKNNGFGIVKLNAYSYKGRVKRYTFQCDRYGEPKPSRGANLRARKSRKCGCKWKLIAEALNEGAWLLRLHDNPEHHQHNHGPSAASSAHPSHRRLTKDAKATIESTSRRVGIRARDVRAVVQDQHPELNFTKRDIYNARSLINREKLGGLGPTAALIKLFDEQKVPYIVKWADDNPNRLLGLVWTFPYCIGMWKRFPEVISFDNTYNTNRFKLPLFQATGQTCLRTVFNTAFGLIDNEKREGFQFLAESIKQLIEEHSIQQPDVIITDFDGQMKAALNDQFPEVQQQLCIHHINSNVQLRAKQKWLKSPGSSSNSSCGSDNEAGSSSQVQLSTANQQSLSAPVQNGIPHTFNGVFAMWKLVVFAETEEVHDKAWINLCKEFNDQRPILRYLYGTYMPIRAQWARCFIQNYRNFGIRVTSGTEASNNNIKGYLLNGMSNLYRLVEAMQDMIKDQSQDFIDGCASDEVLTAPEYLRPSAEYLGELRTLVSSKCLALITAQYRLAKKAMPTAKNPFPAALGDCVCSVPVELA